MSEIQYDSAGLTWEPLPAELEGFKPRFAEILSRWDRTPYMSGQDCCGVQSDCIGFVFRAVDELYRRPTPERVVLPPDSSMHDREGALRTMRFLCRAYAPTIAVIDGRLQPADVVVVGPALGGPAHILTVGPRRNTLWHCTNRIGVNMTGIGFVQGAQQVFAVYRFADREKWL